MNIIKEIQKYLSYYKKGFIRSSESLLKPLGLLGIVIFIGDIFFTLFVKLKANILALIAYLSIIIGFNLCNFEILKRVWNKKADEIDKDIADRTIVITVIFSLIFLITLVLMIFHIKLF